MSGHSLLDDGNRKLEDRLIRCKCGYVFNFTSGEQKYYAERKFKAPTRCKKCRAEKKKEDASIKAVPLPLIHQKDGSKVEVHYRRTFGSKKLAEKV